MTELKRCPFCGGEAEWAYLVPDGAIIGCKDAYSANPKCRIKPEIRRYRGDKEKSLEVAISDWNSRPNPWHTGTPTEEGWYLVWMGKIHGNEIEHPSVMLFENGDWASRLVANTYVAWQKIEPYKASKETK